MLLRRIIAHNRSNLSASILKAAVLNVCPILREASSFSFRDIRLQIYLESLRQEFYDLRLGYCKHENKLARIQTLSGIVKALEEHHALQGNIASPEEVQSEQDAEMRALIEEENQVYNKLLTEKEEEICSQLLDITDGEAYPSVIFEVSAGAGGQEAMLFASELSEMYQKHFVHMGWSYEIISEDTTDIGGLRYINIVVEDAAAFRWLRNEAGVHRVQRIPATEKASRIHTSTASITVIPRPADIVVNLLEKDLRIDTKRASGAGGQHVNTTDSAVRITHLPTGTIVESQSERSQIRNKEIAMRRLHAKLEQAEIERTLASSTAAKKSQQGNKNRNEKIRTYNFPQDRITDHRIQGGTMHHLEEFFKGTQQLSKLIERVITADREAQLEATLASIKIEKTENDLKNIINTETVC